MLVWINLRSSFWFVPALMIVAAGILAVGMAELDAHFGAQFAEQFPRLFQANSDGARNILAGIANSMMTVAGVTFSITIVALCLAASQYSSRILRNFMRDRATQIVLGVFLSIFVYCLIALRTIRNGYDSFAPSFSIATAILLGIVAVAFLTFFVHHVATSIQASTIISRIGGETVGTVEMLFPEKYVGEENLQEIDQCLAGNSWVDILSTATGYVQTTDLEDLLELAQQHDFIVQLLRSNGEFAIAGKPIARIAKAQCSDEIARQIAASFNIAPVRTIEQDPAFGIRQLVDISLRALSPGVNDTTTAVTCINYLGAILRVVGGRKLAKVIHRHTGKIRLIVRTQSYEFLVDESFNQIRQISGGNVAVHLAMLDAMEAAALTGLSDTRKYALRKHLLHLAKVVDAHVPDGADQAILHGRIQKIGEMLGGTA